MNKKGSVFITTMITMLLMVMVGGSIFSVATQDFFFINRLKKSLQAQYLAEAGLATALSTLNIDFTRKSTASFFPLTTLGDGTYDATVSEPISNRVMVSSVGTVSGVQRTVSAEVTPPTISALAYMLAGGSAIDLRLTAFSTCDVTGDIYAATTINMRATANAASINIHNAGDVYAGGTITNGGGTITYGSLNPNYAGVIGFPVMDFNFYQTEAQDNGYYYSTDMTFNSVTTLPVDPAGGVIFINGDVLITDTQPVTTACIVATGSITITQGTTTIAQYLDYPAMLTRDGNITIRSVGNSAQGKLIATGLVYSGNDFSLSGNHNTAVVTGSIIARGTLEEIGTQCALTMIYVLQNPTGMISSGGSDMTIQSYNR
jgi:hypothetical protein